MSRKLATIIKDSAIPGKYKRVLEAYAAFANNDGTNIYASKEKIGKKAGSSPDTIYRNTPDLLACGILTVAAAHTCRIENCNKGATHFTGAWGHYTTAYNLHIEQLQNAETYLCAKQQKVNAAKCRKAGTADCGTTQPSKETPAALGIPDSSALTSGERKEERKPLLAPLVANGDHEQEKPNSSGLESEEQKNQNQPQEQDPEPEGAWLAEIHPSCWELQDVWRGRTGYRFSEEEFRAADSLVREHRGRVVLATLRNALYERPESAKFRWNKFTVFARNWTRNHEAYLAYCVSAHMNPKLTGRRVAIDPIIKFGKVKEDGYFSTNPENAKRFADLAKWFRENNKSGDWTITPADFGLRHEHTYVAMLYVVEEKMTVTKEEFTDILLEAAGYVKTGEEAKAASAGFDVNDISGEKT